jgi:hypothetical protein
MYGEVVVYDSSPSGHRRNSMVVRGCHNFTSFRCTGAAISTPLFCVFCAEFGIDWVLLRRKISQ